MQHANNHFNWTEARWTTINTEILLEAALLRRARRDEGSALTGSGRVFNPFGPQDGNFVDHVVGYKVDEVEPDKRLSVSAGQSLVPVKIWVEFQLSREQFNDENVATALATKAAYRVALGEDHVILHGADAAPFLDQLHVRYEYLEKQTACLTRDRNRSTNLFSLFSRAS